MGPRQLAAEALKDRSSYALIAANLLAIVVALAAKMSVHGLMLVYWIQSVIIGLSFLIRMLSLERFTTEGLKSGGSPVPASAAGKKRVALFFAVHYGFFHLIYALFLLSAPASRTPGTLSDLGFWVCAAAFAVCHGYSLLENIAKDRAGTPNLGLLMFLPYARIVPMHLTMLFGGLFFGGAIVLLFFCLLKTAADVLMHTVEHHALRTSRAAEGSQQTVSSTTS